MSFARPRPASRPGPRPRPRPDGTTRSLERAQLVWRQARRLAGRGDDPAPFEVVRELLRTAQHGPSTMLHALNLGRAELLAAPDDATARDAVHLLSRTITWLGRRPDDTEVGASTGIAPDIAAPG